MSTVASSTTPATIAAATAAIAATGSQISKQNETLYQQGNLLGTWTGQWSDTKQPVTFKVLKITGATAQIEYDHNGQVQKGQASVSQNSITFDGITIGTNDGTSGAFEFSAGTITKTGTLTKAAASTAAADPTHLVGSWSGLTSTGNAASFTVNSITGTSASVSSTINGNTNSGTGTYNAANNVITFGSSQISLNSSGSANVIFTSLGSTYSVPVTKASTSASKTSTTSTFA
jgi:hypothetical protein